MEDRDKEGAVSGLAFFYALGWPYLTEVTPLPMTRLKDFQFLQIVIRVTIFQSPVQWPKIKNLPKTVPESVSVMSVSYRCFLTTRPYYGAFLSICFQSR